MASNSTHPGEVTDSEESTDDITVHGTGHTLHLDWAVAQHALLWPVLRTTLRTKYREKILRYQKQYVDIDRYIIRFNITEQNNIKKTRRKTKSKDSKTVFSFPQLILELLDRHQRRD